MSMGPYIIVPPAGAAVPYRMPLGPFDSYQEAETYRGELGLDDKHVIWPLTPRETPEIARLADEAVAADPARKKPIEAVKQLRAGLVKLTGSSTLQGALFYLALAYRRLSAQDPARRTTELASLADQAVQSSFYDVSKATEILVNTAARSPLGYLTPDEARRLIEQARDDRMAKRS